jgi:hypothetical protein
MLTRTAPPLHPSPHLWLFRGLCTQLLCQHTCVLRGTAAPPPLPVQMHHPGPAGLAAGWTAALGRGWALFDAAGPSAAGTWRWAGGDKEGLHWEGEV